MEHVEEIDVQTESEDMQEEVLKPELEKAPFVLRFCANVIDIAIYISAIFFPYLLLGTPFSLNIFFAITIAAHLLKDSIKGQSLGKFIFGLGVRKRDDSSELPSFGRRILRNLTLSRLTGTRIYRVTRRKTWVTSLLFLAFLALPFLMVILMPERDTITAEEFMAHMEEWNLTVHDHSYNVPDSFIHAPLGDIETYLRVDTSNLVLEFLVLSTDARARALYTQTVQDIARFRVGAASSYTEMGFSNFSRFTQTGSGQYIVVSRIGNTLVYAHTEIEYRADLNRMLRAMGY